MNRYGEEWFVIRKKTLKRDEFKCRKCGRPANDVHHIIPFSRNHNNHLTNLVTLCDGCHKTADNTFLKIGVTKFLKNVMLENLRKWR